MSKHLVFVYGTLKEGYGNHRIIEDAHKLGEALTLGDHFTMYGQGHAFPQVVPEGPCRIKGELYEVDDDHLARMDMLEGHPNFYVRKEVEVETTEDSYHHSAWMYVIPSSRKRAWGLDGLVEPDETNVCEWHRGV